MTQQLPRPEEDGEQAQFIEPNTHTFILKVWLLEQDEVKGRAGWRGHVTHVASGQRVYFDTLGHMNNFLIPYLKGMGIKLPFWWRAYRWLTQ